MPERMAAAELPKRRLEGVIGAGLELARAAGVAEPSLRDAVWTLLQEAGDTLRRLPDRERGWLTAASRAHWPDHLTDGLAAAAGGVPRLRAAPASAAAVDRLDSVLDWLPRAGGSKPSRDVAVLLGLACGVRVAALRRQLGCSRRTVYDIRDRGLARICGHLRSESAYCRHLP